jgi:hypothetical protein
MNPNHQAWQRLLEAARRAPAEAGDSAAPYGFAARIAAQAMAANAPRASLFEYFSLRALGAACLLTLVAVGAGVPALVRISHVQAPVAATATPEAAPSAASPSSDDPVADLVDMAS